MSATYESREVWFLTGSQHLYGPEVLDQVADQRRRDRARPGRLRRRPGARGHQAGAHRDRRDPPGADRRERRRRCVGVIAWMHTFSPGEDVDHRARPPPQAAAAPAHAGQPGAAVGRDRHGLHEPQPGRPRRPGVRGASRPGSASPARRWPGTSSDPEVARRVGVWARAAVGRAELSTMRLARFGDNMRNVAVTEGDKVEAERRFGVSVNTWGVNDLVAVVDEVADADVDALVTEYADTLRRAGRAAARRRPARVAALRRPDRAGPAVVPRRGRLRGVHHELRGPRRAAPAARAWPCSG